MSFIVNKDAQTHFILVIDRRLLGCIDKINHVIVNDVDKFKMYVFELHKKKIN